jgi:hypothetical protein
MLQAACSRGNYPLFVKYVSKNYPQIANEFLSTLDYEPPHDSDLNNIQGYYSLFQSCDVPTNTKKVFAAAIVALYAPAAFKQSSSNVSLKWGLGIAIAEALGVTKQRASVLIKDAIFHYKHYDDLKEQVDQVIEKMKGGQNG